MSGASTTASRAGGSAFSPLAAYPHIACCTACVRYAGEWLPDRPTPQVVTATLAYHDSGHSYDPLTVASEHFAAPF